jgi:glycosyltransferase involved in cell wall biosynthesis
MGYTFKEVVAAIDKYIEMLAQGKANLDEIHPILVNAHKGIDDGLFNNNELEIFCGTLSSFAEQQSIAMKIYYWSFIAFVTKNSKYWEMILKEGLHSLEPLTADFLGFQYLTALITDRGLESKRTNRLLYRIHKRAFDAIYNQLLFWKKDFSFMPKSERNRNYCIVMSTQYLNDTFAPTKTLMGRCRTLQESLGVKTDIINTKEGYYSGNETAFYKVFGSNHNSDMDEANSVSFWGSTYGFYQPKNPAPDISDIISILSRIRKEKPYFIVQIGGHSFIADLCAKLVPVLTVPINSVNIPQTFSQFMTTWGKITEARFEELKERGFVRESIIEGAFTYDLKEQFSTLSRNALGLPKDKFLICLIGNRLDKELDDDFLDMMSKTIQFGIHYVFIGATFQEISTPKFNSLALEKHCSFLGFQEDVLAVLECCDLYVNPKRQGGGASVVEAMYKGLPAVTLRYGDVYINTGEDFGVDTYDEMVELIGRYVHDKNFYNEMSEKAKERTVDVLDTNKAFSEMIHKMLDSPLFL